MRLIRPKTPTYNVDEAEQGSKRSKSLTRWDRLDVVHAKAQVKRAAVGGRAISRSGLRGSFSNTRATGTEAKRAYYNRRTSSHTMPYMLFLGGCCPYVRRAVLTAAVPGWRSLAFSTTLSRRSPVSPTNTSTLAENNRYSGAIARTTYRRSSGEEQRKSHTRLRISNTQVNNVRPVNCRPPNDEGTKNHLIQDTHVRPGKATASCTRCKQ